MNCPPEQIEREFDVLFEAIKYLRVDKLVGGNPDFSNADYIDLTKKVVVELKVINKDFFKEGGVVDAINGIIPVPKDVNSDGTGWYELKMPQENRNGRVDTMEEPLRRIIKKANVQLKETNSRLLDNKGVGFLILAINMETSIDPAIIRAMTIKILKKEFKSVNGVIFCTPKGGILHKNGMIQPVVLHCNEHNLSKDHLEEFSKLVHHWADFVDNGGHD